MSRVPMSKKRAMLAIASAIACALVVANYFEPFLEDLSGTTGDALESADYVAAAKAYLAECGLSGAEIEQLQAFICE